jgi:hypothetical protein
MLILKIFDRVIISDDTEFPSPFEINNSISVALVNDLIDLSTFNKTEGKEKLIMMIEKLSCIILTPYFIFNMCI